MPIPPTALCMGYDHFQRNVKLTLYLQATTAGYPYEILWFGSLPNMVMPKIFIRILLKNFGNQLKKRDLKTDKKLAGGWLKVKTDLRAFSAQFINI